MWPARKSDGSVEDSLPNADRFAITGEDTLDLDYAYDGKGNPIATGLRVKPCQGREPDLVKDGTLEGTGKVARIIRNRRPGRSTIVWVSFAHADNPDLTERLRFEEQHLLVVGSATGM